jgi:drug/metabolite transporter (DMT)-like permease
MLRSSFDRWFCTVVVAHSRRLTVPLSPHHRFWLILMTVNNIAVTLINKAAFSMVRFPYPYMLTVIHMFINWLFCEYIFYSIGRSSSRSSGSSNMWIQLLGNSEDLHTTSANAKLGVLSSSAQPSVWVVGIYSIIFSMNIAIGNVSLQYVSVNFNQVMRSLVPIFTLWCSWYCLNQRNISFQRRLAIWPVVIGVAMAAIGDRMSVTVLGFFYTLLCVILAAVKVVSSSELLTGAMKMHPLRLLQRMTPLAFVQCLLLSVATGEFSLLQERWYLDLDPFTTHNWIPVLVLILSGILAFSLNICALQAYKVTSPITCCIAAAVKQVLMVVCGTYMFQTKITPLNGLGIVIVLIGSTYYSYVSITEPKFYQTKSSNVSSSTVPEGSNHHHRDDLPNEDAAASENHSVSTVSSSRSRLQSGDQMDPSHDDEFVEHEMEEGIALLSSSTTSGASSPTDRFHTSTAISRR